MSGAIDPVELAMRLIACPSVTPARGAVFDVLEKMLRPLGFAVHRFVAVGRPAATDCHYPDVDMHLDGASQRFIRKEGSDFQDP